MPTKTEEMEYSLADTFVKSKRQRRHEKKYPNIPWNVAKQLGF